MTTFSDPRKWAKIQAFAGGPAGPHFFTFFDKNLTFFNIITTFKTLCKLYKIYNQQFNIKNKKLCYENNGIFNKAQVMENRGGAYTVNETRSDAKWNEPKPDKRSGRAKRHMRR